MSVNLIVLPDFFQSGSWEIDGVYSFYPVTKAGKTNCIQLNRNLDFVATHTAGINELNGKWTSIHPGDHLVLSGWLYVEDQTSADISPNRGGRMALDLYAWDASVGYDRRLCEISTSTGQQGYVPSTDTYADISSCKVARNTNVWTFVKMDFVVQNQYEADGYGGYPSGTIKTPSSFTCGFANVNGNAGEGATGEAGRVWIWNPELYVNPTSTTKRRLTISKVTI